MLIWLNITKYSGIPISLASKGNKNWFEKWGVWNIAGKAWFIAYHIKGFICVSYRWWRKADVSALSLFWLIDFWFLNLHSDSKFVLLCIAFILYLIEGMIYCVSHQRLELWSVLVYRIHFVSYSVMLFVVYLSGRNVNKYFRLSNRK